MLQWLPAVAAIIYFLASWQFLRVERHAHSPLWALGVMVLACQVHALGLIYAVGQGDGLNLSVFNVVSVFAWSVACLSVLWLWRASVALAGVIINSINVIIVVLPLIFVSEKPFLSTLETGMVWHILTAIAAWTVLTIATIHALLYGMLYQRLKQKQLKKNNIMSLVGFERVMIVLTVIGFVLLSVSLVTGWLFVEDLFAQHLWHKTVLTMLAWLVYAWLLFAYFIAHQRGLAIVHVLLGAYVLLIAGYVVSNIVLQFVVV